MKEINRGYQNPGAQRSGVCGAGEEEEPPVRRWEPHGQLLVPLWGHSQADSGSGKESWHLKPDVAAGVKVTAGVRLAVPTSKQAQGTCSLLSPAILPPSSALCWQNLPGRQLTKEKGPSMAQLSVEEKITA